jgi:hypothetical protein
MLPMSDMISSIDLALSRLRVKDFRTGTLDTARRLAPHSATGMRGIGIPPEIDPMSGAMH